MIFAKMDIDRSCWFASSCDLHLFNGNCADRMLLAAYSIIWFASLCILRYLVFAERMCFERLMFSCQTDAFLWNGCWSQRLICVTMRFAFNGKYSNIRFTLLCYLCSLVLAERMCFERFMFLAKLIPIVAVDLRHQAGDILQRKVRGSRNEWRIFVPIKA